MLRYLMTVGLVLVVGVGWSVMRVYRAFEDWQDKQTARDINGTIRVDSQLGPVLAFDRRPEADSDWRPTLVLLHAEMLGPAQYRHYQFLVTSGFRLLVPARPGYLGTPLGPRLRSGAPEVAESERLTAGPGEESATGKVDPVGRDDPGSLTPGSLTPGSLTEDPQIEDPLADAAFQADWLASILDHLGLDRVGVIGTGAGGLPALAFAERYPKRIWALILDAALVARRSRPPVDTAIGTAYDADPWIRDGLAWAWYLTSRYLSESALNDLLMAESTLTATSRSACVATILLKPNQLLAFYALVDAQTPIVPRQPGTLADLAAVERAPDSVARFADLEVPTLVLHSSADRVAPIDKVEELAGFLPRAQKYIFQGCGHRTVFGQDADYVHRRMVQFLAQHMPKPRSWPKSGS